jgi:hypothetical protein
MAKLSRMRWAGHVGWKGEKSIRNIGEKFRRKETTRKNNM